MNDLPREWVPKADDYVTDKECSSPIRELIPLIAASPFKLAPERDEELRALLDSQGIRMQFDSERAGFNVSIDVETHEITFGLGAAERIWAYVYGYTSILKCTEKQVGNGSQIDLTPISNLSKQWR
jgi:hypothetical protein